MMDGALELQNRLVAPLSYMVPFLIIMGAMGKRGALLSQSAWVGCAV